MRLIEFVGMVGAGKSTLAERLTAHLRAKGRDVISVDEALGRAASSRRRLRAVTGSTIARRLTLVDGIARFALSNRALIILILYCNASANFASILQKSDLGRQGHMAHN